MSVRDYFAVYKSKKINDEEKQQQQVEDEHPKLTAFDCLKYIEINPENSPNNDKMSSTFFMKLKGETKKPLQALEDNEDLRDPLLRPEQRVTHTPLHPKSATENLEMWTKVKNIDDFLCQVCGVILS